MSWKVDPIKLRHSAPTSLLYSPLIRIMSGTLLLSQGLVSA